MSHKENGILLTAEQTTILPTKQCSCFKVLGYLLPCLVVLMIIGVYVVSSTFGIKRFSTMVVASGVGNNEVDRIVLNISKVPDDPSKYVTFTGFEDGRGLGNQLFNLAVVLFVAELGGRIPAILKYKWVVGLDEVFNLNIERFDDLCPCYQFGEFKSLTYDPRIEQLASPANTATKENSIFLSGFFQSWRYTEAIDRRIRRHLQFRPEVRRFADEYLEQNVPSNWRNKAFTRVGIHIRRGDVLNKDKTDFGYTTPNETYFTSAMHHFTSRYQRVQFIVASNDMTWTKEHIRPDPLASAKVNIRFSEGHSTGQDFALLSTCDHVIMSTGTYGWWAAYLAKGTTIYFQDWPSKGSELDRMFTREDFFPPNWIGMSEIYHRPTPRSRLKHQETD